MIEGEALQDFTRMGITIFLSQPDVPPVDPRPPPSFTAILEDSQYHASTPGFGAKPVPPYEKAHGGIDPKVSGASDPLRVPRPKGPSHEDWLKLGMSETGGICHKRRANNAKQNGKISKNQIKGYTGRV